MKRQALQITLRELKELHDDLFQQALESEEELLDKKFLVGIINKEGLSDTWRLE